MKLSIVIVNYNVAYFLEHCLYSVEKAIRGIDAEVFVVDNNSVDNSIEMLKEKFKDVILIENKDNVGFSRANNQAMRVAKGEYILLLNPDTVVEEDTFSKCIEFMDKTPDAGGLGVKMIDGNGKFLKESKRGFPSLWASFCKMSGLTSFFPHSKKYAQYYMGHLSIDKTNEVDILAGAYMMMRKECLDKVGLLDEDYFMYGEDIDLSYRITLGGYKNYYFPETRIIHYKGESTKKASLNYVYTFYNAMAIFASKHLSSKQNKGFSLFIKFAIWLRASLSFLTRIFKNLSLPLLDFFTVFIGYSILVQWWSVNMFNDVDYYSSTYKLLVIPIYIIIWQLFIFFSGGYSKPLKMSNIISGVFFGMVTILVFYSLLPEDLRYSRALVLMGAVLALGLIILTHILCRYLLTKSWTLNEAKSKRFIIIGESKEATRVSNFLSSTDIQPEFVGIVTNDKDQIEVSSLNFVGDISQIKEIVKIYKINEVIFCSKSISQQDIINMMSSMQSYKLHFTIAPPESDFIIGSNTINTPRDLYIIDVNSISNQDNIRKKRLLDILSSLCLLIILPFIFLFLKRPLGIFKNIFMVFFGMRSWVGYSCVNTSNANPCSANNPIKLPKIKKGIVSTKDSLQNIDLDTETLFRLNILYARNYSFQKDISIIIKSFKELGR